MLLHRVLTALVGAPLLIAVMFLTGMPGNSILFCIVFLLAMREYVLMAHKADDRARVVTMAAGLWLYLWLAVAPVVPGMVTAGYTPLALGSMGALAALGAYYLFFPGDMASVVSRLGVSVLGVFYVGGLVALLPRVVHLGGAGSLGPVWLLLLLAVVWMGDTGAYFAGRFLGKRKLYPAVSPNKTWAGSFGGIAGSVVGALVVAAITGFDALSTPALVGLAVAAGVAEQVGDLFESLLKRSFQVKDSGALLPGHGGMLDRIDGVLAAAPVFFLVMRYVNHVG